MSLSLSSSPIQSDNVKESKKQTTIPVVLLAGFLGSGKTTAIQHLLDQTQTESNGNDDSKKLKIGVIVNDVASVNIDAKLLKQSTSFVDVSGDDGNNVIVPSMNGNSNSKSNGSNIWIELQNGCVCCSIQDEWWTAVESLLQNQLEPKDDDIASSSRRLDAIVVELSGVADPLALLQSTQQKALASNRSGGNNSIDLTFRIVTVVDACTFGTDFYTWDLVADRPAWQMRPLALAENGNDSDRTDEYGYYTDNEELHSSPDARRKVAELLAEQVEAAHGILLNKMDVVTPTQQSTAHAMVQALNDQADLQTAVQGRVDPHWILFGTDKDSVEARSKNRDNTRAIKDDDSFTTIVDVHASHSHATRSHDHDHGCSNPTTCTDPTHNHETTQSAISTTEPSMSSMSSLTVQNLSITSFVYKADRPFDMMRLRNVLNQWPVSVSDTLEILGDAYPEPSTTSSSTMAERTNSPNPFTGILRSKGFCWTAPQVWSSAAHGDAWRHDTAMYWSHAGRQMGISTAGKWWASIPDAKMQSYFVDNTREYDRIQREDFVSVEFGDRRQEIVFIGTSLQVEAITAALDECLYTDREMETYRQKLRNFMESRYSAVTASSSSSPSHGLFGVGPVDHTDL